MKARWLGLDVAAVLAFVAIGRDNHESGNTLAGLLETAAPFLMGLLAGWLVTRAWRNPGDLRTGMGAALTAVAVGMILRRFAFGDGTEATFIIVAAAFLTLMICGWRLVPLGYRRVASAR